MANRNLSQILSAVGGALSPRNWRLGRWRVPVIALGIIALPLGLFGASSVGLSSRPENCASCHEIQPYYQQWKTSTHKDVACIDCHTEPGIAGVLKISTSTLKDTAEHLAASFVTPIRADVKDESCLRCHAKESRPEVVFEQSLRVAHSKHQDVGCAQCHGRLVHTVGQTPVNITAFAHEEGSKTCNACHTPEKSPHGPSRVDCASCHSGEIPGHSLTESSGVPPRQTCIDCHNKERVAPPERCQTCHISPHGIDRACSTCHTSTTTWQEKTLVHPFPLEGAHAKSNCTQCHTTGVQPPVPGTPALAIPKGETPSNADQPKPSSECKSCHQSPQPHFGTDCKLCHSPTAPFKKS
ncbi:MAG: cytochrome c3 family protein [Chloroflexota bacterium]